MKLLKLLKYILLYILIKGRINILGRIKLLFIRKVVEGGRIGEGEDDFKKVPD